MVFLSSLGAPKWSSNIPLSGLVILCLQASLLKRGVLMRSFMEDRAEWARAWFQCQADRVSVPCCH